MGWGWYSGDMGKRYGGNDMVEAKGALDNPRCPDYWAHQENVSERLFSGQDVLDQDQDEQVSREAEREYMACEGHDVGSSKDMEVTTW
jgi:hypothetical protein